MTIRTVPYDTAEYLDNEEDIALFAEAVLEDPDPALLRRAVDVIARAHGFSHLAERAKISRRQLIEAHRDPEGDTAGLLRTVLVSASAPASREAAE